MAHRCAVTTNYITSESGELSFTLRVHFTKKSSGSCSHLSSVFVLLKHSTGIKTRTITTSLLDALHAPASCLPIWRMGKNIKWQSPISTRVYYSAAKHGNRHFLCSYYLQIINTLRCQCSLDTEVKFAHPGITACIKKKKDNNILHHPAISEDVYHYTERAKSHQTDQ